jgi:hypothetical protein
LEKSTSYEAPHYAVFSTLLSLHRKGVIEDENNGGKERHDSKGESKKEKGIHTYSY